MLLRFRFSNHRSFRDLQELYFIATSHKDQQGGVATIPGFDEGVLRSLAIYGANASGKTNVLSALDFMRAAVERSHSGWTPTGGVPRTPFVFEEQSGTPSLFEADFVQSGVRYQYGFEVDSERIIEEWLYAFPKGRRQVWFSRNVGLDNEFTFGKNLGGENRRIETLTRPNSLFLSSAAQLNHEQLAPIHRWFVGIRLVLDTNQKERTQFTAGLAKDPTVKDLLAAMLSHADLGICDVAVEDKEFSPLSDAAVKIASSLNPPLDVSKFRRHGSSITLRHRVDSSLSEAALKLEDESRGTQAFFGLAGPVIFALAGQQQVLCVDELDASLHSALASQIVRVFGNSTTNASNSQLLFNTHDTNMLAYALEGGKPLLRRDQVWLVEKDRSGASHLYPLLSFQPRKSENLARGYLQGRYGAVPFMGEHGLLSAFLDKSDE